MFESLVLELNLVRKRLFYSCQTFERGHQRRYSKGLTKLVVLLVFIYSF